MKPTDKVIPRRNKEHKRLNYNGLGPSSFTRNVTFFKTITLCVWLFKKKMLLHFIDVNLLVSLFFK